MRFTQLGTRLGLVLAVLTARVSTAQAQTHCNTDAQCAGALGATHCVDGYCCNQSADSCVCGVCNGADLGDPGAVNGQCSKASVHHRPRTSCDGWLCDGTSTACPNPSWGCFSDDACAEGYWCPPTTTGSGTVNRVCTAKQPNGARCPCQPLPADGKCSDCASGSCSDGVCCNESCGGECQACTAALRGDEGTADGICGLVTASHPGRGICRDLAQKNICRNAGYCDGDGGCAPPDDIEATATLCGAGTPGSEDADCDAAVRKEGGNTNVGPVDPEHDSPEAGGSAIAFAGNPGPSGEANDASGPNTSPVDTPVGAGGSASEPASAGGSSRPGEDASVQDPGSRDPGSQDPGAQDPGLSEGGKATAGSTAPDTCSGGYQKREGTCPLTCTSQDDCAPGYSCLRNHTCSATLPSLPIPNATCAVTSVGLGSQGSARQLGATSSAFIAIVGLWLGRIPHRRRRPERPRGATNDPR